MASVAQLASLVVRQAESEGAETTTVPIAGTQGHCDGGNDFDGRLGVRISAIFVILLGSCLGKLRTLPSFNSFYIDMSQVHGSPSSPGGDLVSRSRNGRSSSPSTLARGSSLRQHSFMYVPPLGSLHCEHTDAGIQLLAPANDALTDPCLTGPITDYDWVEGIALMTVFSLFFAEIMTMRYADFGHDHSHGDGPADVEMPNVQGRAHARDSLNEDKLGVEDRSPSHAPGTDHLGHARNHTDNEAIVHDWQENEENLLPESYAAQMTGIFILEFGVIFHSIFIGLTLAVSGDEFNTLYVVLVFHQTFEGLGLGSRLATAPWPRKRHWTPYVLALAYGFTTPIAIAIGLGVRKSYLPGSQTALIVNGVFDSISAGILIYTGLVELMAHEFMFSPTMQKAKISTVLSAFLLMCLGAGLMALLGKWA